MLDGAASGNLVITVATAGLLVPVGTAVAYFVVMFRSPKVSAPERAHLRAYIPLWIGAVLFFMISEQAAGKMATFADSNTDLRLPLFGWSITAEAYQSVNPAAIVILAPLIGMLFTRRAGRFPSTIMKFVIAVLIAMMAGLGLYGLDLGKHLSQSGWFDPTSESDTGARYADQALGRDHTSDIILLVTPPEGTRVDDKAFGAKVETFVEDLIATHPDIVGRADPGLYDPFLVQPAQSTLQERLFTEDGRHAFISIGVAGNDDAIVADKAKAALEREGFPPEAQRFERSADLRYFGQAFEVRVGVPEGEVDEDLCVRRVGEHVEEAGPLDSVRRELGHVAGEGRRVAAAVDDVRHGHVLDPGRERRADPASGRVDDEHVGPTVLGRGGGRVGGDEPDLRLRPETGGRRAGGLDGLGGELDPEDPRGSGRGDGGVQGEASDAAVEVPQRAGCRSRRPLGGRPVQLGGDRGVRLEEAARAQAQRHRRQPHRQVVGVAEHAFLLTLEDRGVGRLEVRGDHPQPWDGGEDVGDGGLEATELPLGPEDEPGHELAVGGDGEQEVLELARASSHVVRRQAELVDRRGQAGDGVGDDGVVDRAVTQVDPEPVAVEDPERHRATASADDELRLVPEARRARRVRQLPGPGADVRGEGCRDRRLLPFELGGDVQGEPGAGAAGPGVEVPARDPDGAGLGGGRHRRIVPEPGRERGLGQAGFRPRSG